MPGVKNLGNTCYLSSAIQVLANASNIKFPETALSSELQRFRTSQQAFDPHEIKEMLCLDNKQFTGFDQQDANEALLNLINICGLENQFLFNWTISSICESCGRYQQTNNQDIQIVLYKNLFIDDQINEFFSEERVCECGKPVTLKLSQFTPPKQLLVLVQKQNIQGCSKIKFQNNLSIYNYEFKLNSAIYHQGSDTSGHYTAAIRTKSGDFLCNDVHTQNQTIHRGSPNICTVSYELIDRSKIRVLDLQSPCELLKLDKMPFLQHLSIVGQFAIIDSYPVGLKSLSLRYAGLVELPDLSTSPLALLDVSNNKLKTLRPPKSLRVLNISFNRIKVLPDMRQFLNLCVLDCRGLNLQYNYEYLVPEQIQIMKI
eukprot:EST48999.1 Ubiquitin carboxyl-terminal hydrolase domain-containing protein [Spironucleus salmonicida]